MTELVNCREAATLITEFLCEYQSILLSHRLDANADEVVRKQNELIDEYAERITLAALGYVKVIRCKDCKRFGYLGDDMCYLPNGDGGFAGWKVDPEGFCAWGEHEVTE